MNEWGKTSAFKSANAESSHSTQCPNRAGNRISYQDRHLLCSSQGRCDFVFDTKCKSTRLNNRNDAQHSLCFYQNRIKELLTAIKKKERGLSGSQYFRLSSCSFVCILPLHCVSVNTNDLLNNTEKTVNRSMLGRLVTSMQCVFTYRSYHFS